MSVAQATLAYGLTIRTVSLYFIVSAWDDLKPVLPFFDLIFLRRRKGTLSTSFIPNGGAVARLPDEVWEEIRRQLVQEEIANSEDSVLRPNLCKSRHCPVRPSGSKLVTWRSMINGSCDTCKGNYKDFCTDEFSSWSVEFTKVKSIPSNELTHAADDSRYFIERSWNLGQVRPRFTPFRTDSDSSWLQQILRFTRSHRCTLSTPQRSSRR